MFHIGNVSLDEEVSIVEDSPPSHRIAVPPHKLPEECNIVRESISTLYDLEIKWDSGKKRKRLEELQLLALCWEYEVYECTPKDHLTKKKIKVVKNVIESITKKPVKEIVGKRYTDLCKKENTSSISEAIHKRIMKVRLNIRRESFKSSFKLMMNGIIGLLEAFLATGIISSKISGVAFSIAAAFLFLMNILTPKMISSYSSMPEHTFRKMSCSMNLLNIFVMILFLSILSFAKVKSDSEVYDLMIMVVIYYSLVVGGLLCSIFVDILWCRKKFHYDLRRRRLKRFDIRSDNDDEWVPNPPIEDLKICIWGKPKITSSSQKEGQDENNDLEMNNIDPRIEVDGEKKREEECEGGEILEEEIKIGEQAEEPEEEEEEEEDETTNQPNNVESEPKLLDSPKQDREFKKSFNTRTQKSSFWRSFSSYSCFDRNNEGHTNNDFIASVCLLVGFLLVLIIGLIFGLIFQTAMENLIMVKVLLIVTLALTGCLFLLSFCSQCCSIWCCCGRDCVCNVKAMWVHMDTVAFLYYYLCCFCLEEIMEVTMTSPEKKKKSCEVKGMPFMRQVFDACCEAPKADKAFGKVDRVDPGLERRFENGWKIEEEEDEGEGEIPTSVQSSINNQDVHGIEGEIPEPAVPTINPQGQDEEEQLEEEENEGEEEEEEEGELSTAAQSNNKDVIDEVHELENEREKLEPVVLTKKPQLQDEEEQGKDEVVEGEEKDESKIEVEEVDPEKTISCISKIPRPSEIIHDDEEEDDDEEEEEGESSEDTDEEQESEEDEDDDDNEGESGEDDDTCSD